MPETFIYQPPEKKQIWGQLCGSSIALALAEYSQQTAGIKLIIAPDNLTAAQLKTELQFFLSESEVLLFPDWEILPYDIFSPHQDLISERLATLSRMQQTKNAIVIGALSTLMHRLPPVSFVHHHALFLEKGQILDLDSFRQQLEQAGYRCVNKVLEHGEFAVRGALIDLYPMGSKLPFRIDLFDDSIDSLRLFDPETQCTIEKKEKLEILPAREFPLNETSKTLFRRAFREKFPGNPSACPVYEAISNNQFPAGIEYWLPLFFEQTATIFDYLPESASIVLIENIQQKAEAFFLEVKERYEQLRHDVLRPILPPNELFITPERWMEQVNTWQQLRCYSQTVEKKKGNVHNFSIEALPDLLIDRKAAEPLHKLKAWCSKPDHYYLLIAESTGRREVLLDLLKQSGIQPPHIVADWQDFIHHPHHFCMTIAPIAEGFSLADASISVITESALFKDLSTPQKRSHTQSIDPDLIIRNMAELTPGTPVVHVQFGVGRYKGLEFIESQGVTNEFLVLAYAGEDKIYVPVTSLHQVTRYTGSDAEHAPLHKLGTDKWQKDKKKAIEKIHDVAVELLDMYAKRDSKPGHAYTFDPVEYQRFASGFPFTETADQLHSIEAIIKDLKSPRPMDRLICGDVGFGKTEVAMRAAFMAVQNGKQVCVLVPTTLLAGQHFQSFSDRFADFAVNIGLLSRFRTPKETKAVLEGLQSGKIDIVIGTHKLFQKSIQFKNLGLLIIDEEHRFGVKQKEHIRAIRTHIDILSMTATPIPRTLNMAMSGLRDISLIATPPSRRLSIKTFWQEKKDHLLREAMLREILRGGQVFFLHNNIETIQAMADELNNLMPEAKIAIAHGQMRERDLERIMSDFYHHRFNILLCTTIIETGIDIPTANTIIINRADTFGLAQLHQLRGRVGRSHHQAYAYLLTPPEKLLTPDAVKRLEAIVALEDLGAGFTLATHDLEIRGAGELLGEEQSGNMHAIGFTLFMELLDKAIADLKSGKTPVLHAPMQSQGTEIDLRLSAIIPEDYIGDIHNRLIMYKRIAHAKDVHELSNLQVELIDRFGLLPLPVKQLFALTALKIEATALGVKRISSHGQQAKLEFDEKPSINPGVLINLIQVHAKRYKMEGAFTLKFTLDKVEALDKIQEIADLLVTLRG